MAHRLHVGSGAQRRREEGHSVWSHGRHGYLPVVTARASNFSHPDKCPKQVRHLEWFRVAGFPPPSILFIKTTLKCIGSVGHFPVKSTHAHYSIKGHEYPEHQGFCTSLVLSTPQCCSCWRGRAKITRVGIKVHWQGTHKSTKCRQILSLYTDTFKGLIHQGTEWKPHSKRRHYSYIRQNELMTSSIQCALLFCLYLSITWVMHAFQRALKRIKNPCLK